LKSGEPFAFAGLYEENEINGTPLPTFAIITTEPNELMRPIHNRMPVILRKDAEAEWLNPDTPPEQALELLAHDIPADTMEAYPVSTNVNWPTYDKADLLQPMT
jgi:putative SOS response-associated peptidase YedK